MHPKRQVLPEKPPIAKVAGAGKTLKDIDVKSGVCPRGKKI